jgi:CHAD domain-containing protein
VTSGSGREIEWQFDALDVGLVLRRLEELAVSEAAPGLVLSPGPSVRQVDVYLDTDDARLRRAGYSLRIRRLPRNRAEATLKSTGGAGAGDGLRNRLELTEQLGGGEAAGLGGAYGPVGERVRALAGNRRLQPLFEVHTRRRKFAISNREAPVGEIAVDETAIRRSGGRPVARLRRVEVEVPEPAVDAVEPLVEWLRVAGGLRPAELSKYEAGLVATGIQSSAGDEGFGPTEIGPDSTIGATALAVLRRQFAAMLAHEPGTRLGDDIEELHDMRVATRRLRAAIKLFGEYLPVEAVRLGDELAWIGRTIGSVRDLDVQLAQLDEWAEALPEPDRAPLDRLRALLLAERGTEREVMLEVLDSRRYDVFVRRFGRMLRAGRGTRTPLARAIAPELIECRHRAVRKAVKRIGPDSPPSDYHRARIKGKRLRYALEFLADVYPGTTKTLTRSTVALQDILGGIQDAHVAAARLRGLAADRQAPLPPETVFAMGEVAERYRRELNDLEARVPNAWAKIKGKRWRSVAKALEAATPPPSPRRQERPPADGPDPALPETTQADAADAAS